MLGPATYDYKPGEFLMIDGGTSPDKKFSIVVGESKSGDFGIYLKDAQTKKLSGELEEVATGLDSELLPGDKCRIVKTQPVEKEKKNEE